MKLARTKEWRESHGLTQRELAAEAGVGEVTVARVEAGTSVSPPTARKLAEALDVSVADLLERPPVPLAEMPDQGPRLLGKGLDAARRDEEKTAKAVRRLFASEGVLPSTNMDDFEEDRYRAELRELGLPDELFEALVWPLVVELHQTRKKFAQVDEENAQLRQNFAELRAEVERERAHH